MSDARQKLAELRDLFDPDELGRQRAAEQLIQDVKRAARAAMCAVERIEAGICVSIPRVRCSANVTAAEGVICIGVPQRHGPPTERPFQGLKYDPLARVFVARGEGSTSVVDALLVEVTQALRGQLDEIVEQRKQRANDKTAASQP